MNSIPVLGTEPASENRIRSCCGSMPGIRFYCKPVTLVRCGEIRGENRFSGRVGGKWLCEMISAFIIKELRGAWALRLFCGRSAFPPPFGNPRQSQEVQNPLKMAGFFIRLQGRIIFGHFHFWSFPALVSKSTQIDSPGGFSYLHGGRNSLKCRHEKRGIII